MKDCCQWCSDFGSPDALSGVLSALKSRDDNTLRRYLTQRQANKSLGEEKGSEVDNENCKCSFCHDTIRMQTTPLHMAAERGASREAMGLLLSEDGGAFRFLSSKRYFDQRTPLSVAISNGALDAAMALMDATVNNSTLADEVVNSPLLHEAAQRGLCPVLENLCSLSEACDLDVSVDRQTRVRGGVLTPLECALRGGFAEAARCLLAHGADARIGRPLLWAVRSGGECCDLELMKELIKHGCDVNTVLDEESNPTTALLWATSLARSATVEMLLSLGANAEACGMGGRNALTTYVCAVRHRAREMDDLEQVLNVVRCLAADARSVLSQDDQGRTLFHHVLVQYRRSPHLSAFLSVLLASGDTVAEALNVPNHDGTTPLHLALGLSSKALPSGLARSVTTMLLDGGANPNGAESSFGPAPLLVALCGEYCGNPDRDTQLQLVELLLEKGAQTDHGDAMRTPLMAVLLDNDDQQMVMAAMTLLLKYGADINGVNRHGETALHHCVKVFATKSDTSMIEELLKQGADPNQCDSGGFTALHIAAQCVSAKVIHLLLWYGATLSARTNQGDSALHLLGRHPNSHNMDLHQELPAAFSLLILAGCPTTGLNHYGSTPLEHLTRTWIRCSELADRLVNTPLMLRDIVRATVRRSLHPCHLSDIKSALGTHLPDELCKLLEGDWLIEREVGGPISDDEDDSGFRLEPPKSPDADDEFNIEGCEDNADLDLSIMAGDEDEEEAMGIGTTDDDDHDDDDDDTDGDSTADGTGKGGDASTTGIAEIPSENKSVSQPDEVPMEESTGADNEPMVQLSGEDDGKPMAQSSGADDSEA